MKRGVSMAVERDCTVLELAEDLARRRGLVNGEGLSCAFVSNCTGAVCHIVSLASEDGVEIANQNSKYYNMVGKFFTKLIRSAQINGLWDKLDETDRTELAQKYMQNDGMQTSFDRSRFNGQT